MQKLSSKKGKVHPSPEPASNLSFLPATILTLAATLSPEDKQVLAYLISFCGTTTNNNKTADNYKTTRKSFGGGDGGEHEPLFDCNCFRCYKSFWARWDTSPNRQLIHEIIEVYEDGWFRENYKRSPKKKKRGRKRSVCDHEFKNGESGSPEVISAGTVAAVAADDLDECHDDDEEDGVDQVEVEKGSVTKIVNFLGERIWNFWSMN